MPSTIDDNTLAITGELLDLDENITQAAQFIYDGESQLIANTRLEQAVADGELSITESERDLLLENLDKEIPRPIQLFRKPFYERQPDESNKDYQRFLTYASQHPENRSIARSWRIWVRNRRTDEGFSEMDDKELPSPTSDYYALARHWRWEERAVALDVARLRTAEQLWIDRDLERRERDWEAAGLVRTKALDALETIQPGDLSAGMVVRYLEVASALQEKATPDIRLGGNQVKEILSGLDDDRRGRIVRLLMAEVISK